ncbi:thiolase family protein [Schlesneria paludicola]|uniref:thiolase family protein n=1 Tax=Schlesneria paludicola TaxID=360056 RepID=UPI00029B3FB5|nr:thiolase family protein [Schlesneria paludicola]
MGVVILSARRTPIGKFQGVLSGIPATELGSRVIRAAVNDAGEAFDDINLVIMGMVLPSGVGQAPARQAAIGGGVAPHTEALTVNQVCGSGLKAVMLADQAIRCGDASLVVAGGMESMSRAPWLIERSLQGMGDRRLVDSMLHDGLSCSITDSSMGEIAERLTARQGISREDQDAFACESHRRATEAQQAQWFKAEIVPLQVPSKAGITEIDRDEGPRADCRLERLAGLRSAFIERGAITAGNSAMISDGAAAVVVASSDIAKARGCTPLVEIVATATATLDPEDLFLAPVHAIRKLLAKAKMQVSDIDIWEINEAFAVQVLADQRLLEIDLERLNPAGGATALGHPIGASGARVLTTLIHGLRRQDREWGVAALCLGGGGAVAMLIKRF